MYEQHTHFLEVLPALKEHTILQRILWEIELANGVIEFVQKTKNLVRSLAAKYSQNYKTEGSDSYLSFKSKEQRKKFQHMLETALRLKVDLTSELSDLKNWID